MSWIPSDAELLIQTQRLKLEPITESHAWEMTELLSDAELHRFVPFEAPTFEHQRERCRKWQGRVSPNRDELWLNWAGRLSTGKLVAHLQAGVKADGVATIGYIVSREVQKQGLATEGMRAVIAFLREKLLVQRVRAEVDTRNVASIALMKKLGFREADFVKGAAQFKGASSDEVHFEWP